MVFTATLFLSTFSSLLAWFCKGKLPFKSHSKLRILATFEYFPRRSALSQCGQSTWQAACTTYLKVRRPLRGHIQVHFSFLSSGHSNSPLCLHVHMSLGARAYLQLSLQDVGCVCHWVSTIYRELVNPGPPATGRLMKAIRLNGFLFQANVVEQLLIPKGKCLETRSPFQKLHVQ